MPITLPQVVVRVRTKVIDERIALSLVPSWPDDVLKADPRLGFDAAGVRALHRYLEREFKPEKLELSAQDLETLNPTTVMDLGSVVYQRIRSYSRADVSKRVIVVIKSYLGPNVTVTENTALGNGGLGMTEGRKEDFASHLRDSFFSIIRLKLSGKQTKQGTHVRDWVALIHDQFTAQGR